MALPSRIPSMCCTCTRRLKADEEAQVVPAGLLFFTFFFCPESPRWLAGRGKNDEALKALARIRGYRADEPEVKDEIAQIITQIREEQAARLQGTWKQKWISPYILLHLTLTVMLRSSALLQRGNWNRVLVGWFMAFGLVSTSPHLELSQL